MNRKRSVRVPASSANLGPGFDVMGAALDLHMDLDVVETGRFAVHTLLEYSPKAGGERRTQEEVGVYTVRNDIVTREEFFYDGPFI